MHVIGTAGHVDHGKSTLVERLTGIDPDRFAEEKRRGLTIDLGFAWLTLPSGEEVGLVDVPGHERFIKNMLAGAGGVSVCLFVVAANEGWKPQSAEHLSIVDVLGIESGVVALTKADLVDQVTIEEVSSEVSDRLAGTSLAGAPIVPCSASTGDGIDALLRSLDASVARAPRPVDRSRPRLWVDRAFTISGAGTVVTGTLMGGSLDRNDTIELSPASHKARIRTIQNHKKEVDGIGPGNRVALNLSGLDRHAARRGDAVVLPGQWIPTRRVDAVVRVLPEDVAGRSHELIEKGAHLMYVGSAETAVRVKLLDTNRLGPGESGFAQLTLNDPLPLGFGDRFVLRDAGRVTTFGGGRVLDPLSEPARRSDASRVDLLARLSKAEQVADPIQWMALALLGAEGEIPVNRLLARVGVAELPSHVVVLESIAVSHGHLDALVEGLESAVRAHHDTNPLDRGMDKPAVAAALDTTVERVSALVAHSSKVVDEGRTIRLASHRVRFSPYLEAARSKLLARLDEAGFTPPFIADLDTDPELLKAMIENGDLVRVGDFLLADRRAAEARSRVRTYIEESGPATVAQIRDLLGTSRKYAVPLCEWLDSTGATMRRGDVRILGPRA
ncbi:MAG: selenocysteine-specific elongation factor [Actinomycetota bacterium]|nr:selenocysteine-specific elongation factor [Actinomycetota bacterium]